MEEKDKIQMEEIKDFLTIQYNGASDAVKERIRILLRETQVTRVKCADCGSKFDPQDNSCFKAGVVMFPLSYNPTQG